MTENGQKEQNGFKKLKIQKNQIIYLRMVFSYDGKKARQKGSKGDKKM
ncbi:hypothetical protein [Bacillus sp. FSL H8-0515]|nr:hypothetical protein [Bacillus sp. S20C3]MCY8203665.1 hypothetical protein [Bacillus sp. N12A5]MCY8289769.1 hypothetical protein [Bacillus sp. N13C7]MCY8637729.1 hypothetical protein [Bacillus sp. S17B2]MCY8720266.1 hypothetical protein [Bacillus sp. S10C12M]MCY9144959.1 hypothetical protein [Bacillus sp. T9C1]